MLLLSDYIRPQQASDKAYTKYADSVNLAGGYLIAEQEWKSLYNWLYKADLTNDLGRLRASIGINCPTTLDPISIPLIDPLGLGNSTLTNWSLTTDYISHARTLVNLATLNGGFETEGTGGQPFADWTKWASGATTVNRDTSVFYSGGASCRIDVDASASIGGIQTGFQTSAGIKYRIQFRWRHNNPVNQQVQVRYGAAVGDIVGTGTAVKDTWHYFDTTVTPTQSGVMILQRNGNAGYSCWFDEVTIDVLSAGLGNAANSTKYTNEIITNNQILGSGKAFGGVVRSSEFSDFTNVHFWGDFGARISINNVGELYHMNYLNVPNSWGEQGSIRPSSGNSYITWSIPPSTSSNRGTILLQRSALNLQTVYLNAASVGSNAIAQLDEAYSQSLSMYSHAWNTPAGTAASYSRKHLSCFFCGLAGSTLTEPDIANFHAIMRDFHAAFGVPTSYFA
jgi:hypothetical protein